jgi:hypothetical protein
VRARAGWIVCAGLALVLPLEPAGATQSVVGPPARYPSVGSDSTSVERLAQHSASVAFSATNTGVLVGAGLMLAGIPANSGGVFAAGFGVAALGAIAGPTAGWARAGYPGRAGAGALIRTGLIVGCIAIPLSSEATRASDVGAVAVASAALTGLVLATFEAYLECDGIATYVRRNGPGSSVVGLVPAQSPSGAPGLAVLIHFP